MCQRNQLLAAGPLQLFIFTPQRCSIYQVSPVLTIEKTQDLSGVEGIVNCSRRFLQSVTTAWLVSDALARLLARVREVSCALAGSVVLVLHPTARWRFAGFLVMAFSPGAQALHPGCKALFKLMIHFEITQVKQSRKAWSFTVAKISILGAREGEKAHGRNEPRDRRCQDPSRSNNRSAPCPLYPSSPDTSGKCTSCTFFFMDSYGPKYLLASAENGVCFLTNVTGKHVKITWPVTLWVAGEGNLTSLRLFYWA